MLNISVTLFPRKHSENKMTVILTRSKNMFYNGESCKTLTELKSYNCILSALTELKIVISDGWPNGQIL